MTKTLVIGYGNTLRGDDGVGPRIATAVAGWGLVDVEAIAVHQLTPELAGRLAEAHLVLFVDARLAGEAEPFQVRPLAAESLSASLGHACDPRSLLGVAQLAFGRCPAAWSVTVPATDLALGEGLSPTAAREMTGALREIALLLTRSVQRVDELVPGPEEIRCTKSV